MKYSVRLKIFALMAPIIPFFVVYLVQLQSAHKQAQELQEIIDQTIEIHDQLNMLLINMLSAETGSRGFLVTKNELFLEPYEVSFNRIENDLSRLRTLYDRQQQQQQQLNMLTKLIREKFAFMAENISLRKGQGLAAIVPRMQPGKALMDQIRLVSANMIANQDHLLKQRKSEFSQITAGRQQFQIAAIVGLLVFYIVIAWLLIRTIMNPLRVLTAGAMALTRADYDTRVTLSSENEFGTLGQAFNMMAEAIQNHALQLQDKEVRLRSIIQTAVDGIITINRFGIVESINPAAEQIFGYRRDEIVGHNIEMLMPESYQSQHDSYLHNYLTTGQAKIMGVAREVEGKRKDGTIFPMDLSVSEMFIDGYRMFNGLVRDITEHKALALRSQFVEAIFETSDDAIIGKTLDGIITSWNLGAEKIFGYTEQEMLGQTLFALFPSGREEEEKNILERIKQGEKVDHFETKRIRKDGRLIDVSVTISPILDFRGNIIGASKIARDITERKHLDKLKSEFISVVSHELRTPLASIQGSLGLILGRATGDLSEPTQKLLDIAYANCQRLTRLTDDILTVDKLESGISVFDLKPLAIMPLVRNTLLATQAYADQFGVTYALCEEVADIFVLADNDRLIQVLTNLLSNAAKFSHQGGRVDVAVSLAGQQCRLSVTDYGIGIKEAFKNTIFTKFSQEDTSNSRKKTGTGLGLYISKATIEKMGGTIGFDSISNQHTCFYIELPALTE